MVVWIVEGKSHPDSKWVPFLGYVFETEEGAKAALKNMFTSQPQHVRVSSYFSLRREDLEWAISHLGMYAHSEKLERIKGAIL